MLSPRQSGQHDIFYTWHISSEHRLLRACQPPMCHVIVCMACNNVSACSDVVIALYPGCYGCRHSHAELQGGNHRACRTRGCASCPASDCLTSPWRRPRGEPAHDTDMHASSAGPPVPSNTVLGSPKLARGCGCCNACRNAACLPSHTLELARLHAAVLGMCSS